MRHKAIPDIISAYTATVRARERRAAVRDCVIALALGAGVLAAPAHAQGFGNAYTRLGIDGPLSETRGIERVQLRPSGWGSIPAGVNPAPHEGRSAGVYEDAGMGGLSFEVRAGRDGLARVALQDVGDTVWFDRFEINGQRLDPPSRANGSWFTAVLDFGAAGWHRVETKLFGPRAGKQDGYAVKECRR